MSAWLLLNSIRAEKLCFPLWCLQCSQNVWRKRAFAQLLERHAEFGQPKGLLPGGVSLEQLGVGGSELVGRRMLLDVFR